MRLTNEYMPDQEWATLDQAGRAMSEYLQDLMGESDATPSVDVRDADTGQWYKAAASITLTRHDGLSEDQLEEDWQANHLDD